ncbi:oxidoreductase [Hyphococcus formosus]|uniref:oxidoreductase n=1 Tax=Hyphococcus formosus TaxID=3143534 RepID=UPI00398B12B5
MKNWLITGVSSGIGRALAQEVLANGDKVVGTVRNEADKDAFQSLHAENAFGIILDVTDHEKIPAAIMEAEACTGGLDVLVNNAGFGMIGAIEEVSLEELRKVFEVNFFGAFSVTQAVLPKFRERGKGQIVNVTSVSGLAPWAGSAAYGASKYALECLGQTLAQEVAEFGIKVTNIEPGAIETDFGKRSLVTAEQQIDAYKGTITELPRKVLLDESSYGGDPKKAAKAIVKALSSDEPPTHLLLGEDAVFYAGEQLNTFIGDMTKWMPVTMSIKK